MTEELVLFSTRVVASRLLTQCGSHVGAPPDGCRWVRGATKANKLAMSLRAENQIIEIDNEVSAALSIEQRRRWNPLARLAREICDTILPPGLPISEGMKSHALDVLGSCYIVDGLRDVVTPPPRLVRMLEVLAVGHLPCVYDSSGVLEVY